ncbi:OmpA family protein [Pacificimonas sp. WHA3]|uniref:OmpA family protein n=1 Tax=Pacificimonas pallii TaxID=2827236 RepID=A0ABS6SD75_9SPHN|nr:OmpA family protein [Pacificimonas pallii]MBV7256324.1 OmpA family protein [Pacificimonas pallii]
MRIFAKTTIIAGVASLTLAGCVTNPETGESRIARPAATGAAGAAIGAALGALIGGKSNRTEILVGTGIGAIAGAGVGVYLDEQEKKLRERTAGTGIEVERDGDSLNLQIPSQITFGVDSAIINEQFRPALNEVAKVLTEYDKSFVDVYGHTDSSGSDAYNLTLSERRAESVATYLSANGVQRPRIATKGFGETDPIASNDTAAGRAENRRVEIKIVPITDDTAV